MYVCVYILPLDIGTNYLNNEDPKRKMEDSVYKTTEVLDKKAMIRYGVPDGSDGGVFFWFQETMLQAVERKYGQTKRFHMAWQREKGKYCFATYESYILYTQALLKLPVDKRFGFETIRQDTPACLFLDVEWYGDEDPEEYMGRLLKVICDEVEVEYNVKTVPQICKGSRLTKDGNKNSFHIVVPGLIFSNIHGNAMKNFVIRIKKKMGEVNSDGTLQKDGIDTTVYTRKRNLRTILCSKRDSSEFPLHNVTMDSFLHNGTVLSDRIYADNEEGALGNFSITENDNTGHPHVLIEGDAIAVDVVKSNEKGSNKRSRASMSEKKTARKPLGVGIPMTGKETADLQQLIPEKYRESCIVLPNFHKNSFGYFRVSCRNSGVRNCPIQDALPVRASGEPFEPHETNNAWLGFSNGMVQYRCFSEDCCRSKVDIGEIPASFIALTGMPDHTNERRDNLRLKLATIAKQLYRIHPSKCGDGEEWEAVLQAVIDTMCDKACEGREEAQQMLNTFAIIRPKYTSLEDIASQYTALENTLLPKKQKVLAKYAREWPALVLMSPASIQEQGILRMALNTMSESSNSDLIGKQKAVRELLIQLVFEHTDFSKTDWKWLTQLCSCLVDNSDQKWVSKISKTIIEQYKKCEIIVQCETMHELWNACKSEYQYQAFSAYVQDEFLTKNAAEVYDMDNFKLGENISSLSGSYSTAMISDAYSTERLDNGALSLSNVAKQLMQLSPYVLVKLLQHSAGTQSEMSRFLQLNLHDKKLATHFMNTLETLLEPFSGSGFISQTHVFAENSEINAVFEEDEMDNDENADEGGICEGGDVEMIVICPDESASCIPYETNTFPLIIAATQAFDVGTHTLQSFVLSHGAMRLKSKWSTDLMIPEKMHVALASNLHNSVDWRLTVFWVAFLEFYQNQTKADAIEQAENDLRTQDKGKERARDNELCLRQAKKARKDDIVEEKVAVYAKHKADKVASAAATALIEIQSKLKFEKQKLVTSEMEYLNANSEKRKIAANNVLQKHKNKVNHFTDLELQKINANTEAMETSARTAEILNKIQSNQNATIENAGHFEIDNTVPESVEKIEMCAETLSITLQDYKNRIRLENHQKCSPTLEELDEQWKLVVNLISDGTKKDIMAIGRAIWGACFDLLFSYEAEKALYEETHFDLIDQSNYVQITSVRELVQLNANKASSSCYAVFWGPPKTNHEPLSVCSLADFHAHKIAPQQFWPRWRDDRNKRSYNRVDSVPYRLDSPDALERTDPGTYNTWKGFRAESLPPVPMCEVAELVKPILDHLRMLLVDDESFNYHIAWMAQPVQDPANPTHVSTILQGEQGTGKNIVSGWHVSAVLGSPAGFQTGAPGKDMYGPHSMAVQNCTFAIFDEIEGVDMIPLMSQIKNSITVAQMNVNPKCKTAFTVKNFLNILCTTNGPDCIKIKPGERRFVVFQTSPEKKGDTAYFLKLLEHLKRDCVARAFFQYLRDVVDVTPFLPFQATRPITHAYKTLRAQNISLFDRFLSSIVKEFLMPNTDIPTHTNVTSEEYTADFFFHKFGSWGNAGSYKEVRNINKSVFREQVSVLIHKLDAEDPHQTIFTKKMKKDATYYSIDKKLLHQNMLENYVFEED